MQMTQHAKVRSQQRGIPPIVVDLLMQFGATEPAGGGASKVFFDKAARRRIKAYAGQLASILDEHLDIYAVIGAENQIITMAHRADRIRRH